MHFKDFFQFIKDKNQLDSDYAKNIKNLVSRNRKITPKPEFSTDECFFGWLTEMENIANQYEMIVESVQKTCIAVTNKNLHFFFNWQFFRGYNLIPLK